MILSTIIRKSAQPQVLVRMYNRGLSH